MSDNPFKLISTEIKYKNPWISVREDKVIRPGGNEGLFGVVTMLPGSTVLCVNDKRQVIITREFRYGAERYSLEGISGGITGGETPLQTAQRELEEEVGYRASRWIDAGVAHPFTTVVNSANYMFIATDLVKTKDHPDEGEVITYQWVDLQQALEMVLKSEIIHAGSAMLIYRAVYLDQRGELLR